MGRSENVELTISTSSKTAASSYLARRKPPLFNYFHSLCDGQGSKSYKCFFPNPDIAPKKLNPLKVIAMEVN